MSTNPFTNNNPFSNSQQKPNNIFGTQSQTNIFNNTSNNGSKVEIKNPTFNQQNDSNPFKSKIEPNIINLNNKNNQNENSKNNQNTFFLFNTQQSNKNKEINSSLNTDININQNIKNSTILNINSINNNNNTNQNTSNIFTNTPNKNNIFLNNKNNNNKPNNISIIPQKNDQEIKKEEKKETNIFLTQSNNILNKSNNFPSQSQLNNQVNNSILSQEQKNENIIKNILNPIQEKKEKSKVNEFINSLLSEDKLIFSEKEKKEYEKNQISYKLNKEICEEFKDMLLTQKEKFEKYTSNARLIDKKFMYLINKMKNNASESLNNEIRFRNLCEKIKSTEKKVSNLKSNMNKKDTEITKGLDFLKKNLFNNNYTNNNNNNNNNNNLYLLKNNNLEEKIKFFVELNETSDKIKKIDNNLNIIWNSLNKDEKNINEINFFDINKENENENKNKKFKLNNNIKEMLLEKNNNLIYNYILNNGNDEAFLEKNNNLIYNYILNDDIDGVFLERNNIDNNNNKKQILYLEQKDINNLFTECYDGLYCQKCIQDEFENKYNTLKNKLIDKINESNNNLGKENNLKRDVDMEFNI